MPHRFLLPGIAPPEPGATLEVRGEEARHGARVRRLRADEAVEVLDGAGLRLRGRVASVERAGRSGSLLRIIVEEVIREPAPSPHVELCAPPPRGARMDTLIDMLSQIGAARYVPLETARSLPERAELRLDRLARIAGESAKQCGRAWLLELGERMGFEEAIETSERHVVLADRSGDLPDGQAERGVRVLIGPEGGWTDDELARARRAGCAIVSLGEHVLRVETAGVVGAALYCGVLGRRGSAR